MNEETKVSTPCAICGEDMIQGEIAHRIFYISQFGYKPVLMCEHCANNKTVAEIAEALPDANIAFEYTDTSDYAVPV